MSDHGMIGPRTAIRQRVQRLLQAGLPVWDARITPERVCVNRAIPLSPKKLPAVLIYSRDEKVDKEPNADPGLRRHMLELAVEVVAGGADPQPDAMVDLLATAVELIIDRNETLNLLVEGTRLTRVETDVDGDGDAVFVASRPLFQVVYWTRTLCFREDGLPTFLEEFSSESEKIPGITRRLGDELEDSVPGDVLTSFAPRIGRPHEQDHQPIGGPLERPDTHAQGHDRG